MSKVDNPANMDLPSDIKGISSSGYIGVDIMQDRDYYTADVLQETGRMVHPTPHDDSYVIPKTTQLYDDITFKPDRSVIDLKDVSFVLEDSSKYILKPPDQYAGMPKPEAPSIKDDYNVKGAELVPTFNQVGATYAARDVKVPLSGTQLSAREQGALYGYGVRVNKETPLGTQKRFNFDRSD